jgi:hypothetical protein
MKKSSGEYVKSWRQRTKQRIRDAMGGACVCCGYDKCLAALDFHHIDPKAKDFSISDIGRKIRSWEVIIDELRKCVVLCKNCHLEVHRGLTQIPDDAKRFDESYADYKFGQKEASLNECPICSKKKHKSMKVCSVECSRKSQQKVDWDSLDLVELLKTKSVLALSKELGCSDNAIHKRLRKLGLK